MTQPVIKLIPTLAPPAPRCFSTRDIWIEMLVVAQKCKAESKRPFVDGRYVPSFNFCSGCTPDYQAQMTALKRCDPNGYRRALQPTESKSEA